MMEPSKKVVLITGAARRIGEAIARVLHHTGMNVILHYHSSHEEAEKLCRELNQKRLDSAVILSADLLKKEAIEDLVTKALEPWGRLDALINNAAFFQRGSVDQVDESQWMQMMDTNLKAPFFLSQKAAPYLRLRNGVIINIIDIHAERPLKGYPVYCISKAGMVMLTKTLAKELGPTIRVNGVAPGSIAWPEGENQLSEKEKNSILDRVVLKRHGEPQDIAKAVLFFISEANYVTGQVLYIDGGRHLAG